MATLGDVIRRLRKGQHLSQDQLGIKAGVNGQTISNIETGKVKPHGETFRRISDALGVTPAYVEHMTAPGPEDEVIEPKTRALDELARRHGLSFLECQTALLLLAHERPNDFRKIVERLRNARKGSMAFNFDSLLAAGVRDRKAAKADPDRTRRKRLK